MILRIVRILVAMTALLALAACDRPEPRTVQEFMADEIALTGTLVRCQDMGSESMRDPECQNARRASERLAALEEERERKAREEAFQRKRAALRERQDRERAAREAAAAAARVAEEQALLGTVTFEGETGAPDTGDTAGTTDGEAPAEAAASDQADSDPSLMQTPAGGTPAAAGSSAPAETAAPEEQAATPASDAEPAETEDPVQQP